MLLKLNNQEYHAPSQGISQSQLKQILRSPAHYRLALQPSETTPAMAIGTALHCAVLEPNRFTERYCVIDGNRNSNAVKDAIRTAEIANYTVLSVKEKEKVFAMARAINSHEKAANLLHGGIVEQAMTWEQDGFTFKAKPDLILDESIFVDVKTTRDASPRGFGKSFFEFGYDFQLAFYMEGLQQNGFGHRHPAIIAVENEEPYSVMVYSVPPEIIERGAKRVAKAKLLLKQCVETNTWPGYSQEVCDIEVPYYIQKELECQLI